MARQLSEITTKDISFIRVRNLVQDKIKREDLKEFLEYMKAYLPKKGKE